eukprot:scaffold193727_cov18-Tisochrysis_lutea.AAC.1
MGSCTDRRTRPGHLMLCAPASKDAILQACWSADPEPEVCGKHIPCTHGRPCRSWICDNLSGPRDCSCIQDILHPRED